MERIPLTMVGAHLIPLEGDGLVHFDLAGTELVELCELVHGWSVSESIQGEFG